MLLDFSFATLLANVLLAFNPAQVALDNGPEHTGVMLPIRRSVEQRGGHPLIYLQQRINRANKRLALMTGREPPSDEELESRILRRLADIKPGNSLAAHSQPLELEANDHGLLATFKIGNQDFKLSIEPLVSDSWVRLEGCSTISFGGQPGAADCGNHTLLQSSQRGAFFTGGLGAGVISGYVVREDVTVAGLKLTGQQLGGIVRQTPDLYNVTLDGVVGFARSEDYQDRSLDDTLIEALVTQKKLAEPIASFNLPRADNKNNGEMTLGALDRTKFDPRTLVKLTNLNDRGFYGVNLSDATVDGRTTKMKNRPVVFDLGTGLIFAPSPDGTTLHKLIKNSRSDGQGAFKIPCNFKQTVALNFGGKSFEINPRDMVVSEPVAYDNETGVPLCLSGIAEGDAFGDRTWIVGDVFLKNAYFSTNARGNGTVTLAKLV